uniref:Uncharacterized protein n=1 Tax=Avena sativa TaxID=4498 RepID=A0ACD5WWV2_AVESA
MAHRSVHHRSTLRQSQSHRTSALNLLWPCVGELAPVPQPGTSEAAPMECANGAGAGAGAEGNRSKESDFREQILQLAAIACHEDEKKSRIELLDKLKGSNKCALVKLCCSLDIRGSTSTRKDDIVALLMEFLMQHCSRIDCTDPDQKFRKRKRKSDGANLSGGDPSKKRKPDGIVLETHVEEEADGKKGAEDRTNCSEFDLRDNRNVCTDNKTWKFLNGQAKPEPSEGLNGSTPKKLAVVPLPGVLIPSHEQILVTPPCAELVRNVENNSPDMKASAKKNISVTKKKATHKTDLREKFCGKNVSRGDVKPGKQAVKPTKDELRQAVFCILDTANFTTMTFGEVVKAVDKYFGKDLFERKPLIRALIEEELFRLAEEAEKKELEEEEAMEAKARAEQAAKESAKDGLVESDREKENELEACQDGKSKDVEKSDKSNGIEKGAKSATSVMAGDNRNSAAAAESSQDGEAEVDTKNEHNSDGFTKDGEAGIIVQNANGDDGAEIFKDAKAESANNCNSNTIGGSEDVKAGEHEGTKDGTTRECRTGNDGNTTEKVGVCEPEKSNSNEKGEHVRCSEDGQSQEAGDDGSGENTLSCGGAAECGKASETLENGSTEQSGTDVSDDGKAEDAEQNVNTKVDVESSNHGTAENGKTMDDAITNSNDQA